MKFPAAVECFKHGFTGLFCLLVSGVALQPVLAASPPAVGDAMVYHLVNGYNREILAQLSYRVEKVDAERATLRVTPDRAAGGVERTETVTREGNWLLHAVASHGEFVDYEFSAPFPAYVFPLDPGKTWSVRVPARVPGENQMRSVRVDGTVLGVERVRVPAGEFDAVKIRRFVYPGDTRHFLQETKAQEIDWYVPALGRSVRTETRSEYFDLSMGRRKLINGGWTVLELAEISR